MEDREEMIREAIKRMKLLKLHPNVINDFKEEQRLNKSDLNKGILYWLNEDEQEMIEKLEKKYKFMVYHVIHSYSNLGETYEILFVRDNKEEWKAEREDLRKGYTEARVEVMNCPDNSEFRLYWSKKFKRRCSKILLENK